MTKEGKMKIQMTVSVLMLALAGVTTSAASQQSRVEASTTLDARVESRGPERGENSARDGTSSRAAASSESHLVISRESLEGDGARRATAAEIEASGRARGASDEAIAQLGGTVLSGSALESSRSSTSIGTRATATLGGSLGGSLGSVLGARAGLVGSVGGRIRL